jgi:intracellular sulfur oxidation DsrE/DsrF family protein
MRLTCLLAGLSIVAVGCSNASQPFAFAPARTVSPAPEVKADVSAKVQNWRTVVYANRRPTGDMVFYGLADWRDATLAANEAGATEVRMVFVFDGPALPMVLNDAAYDRVLGTNGGNPWKSLVADLQKGGASVESCGTRMKELGVGNADLLPGVKVDSDGWTRVLELQSKGFSLFQS